MPQADLFSIKYSFVSYTWHKMFYLICLFLMFDFYNNKIV